MNHWLLATTELRAVERLALAGLPPGTLMARAAQAVADEAIRMAQRAPRGQPIEVLVGAGNNGGDALLAAILLQHRGFAVRCRASSDGLPSAADALQVHQRWLAQGGSFDAAQGLDDALAVTPSLPPLVIDGLFGIGLTRRVTGRAAAMIDSVNRAKAAVIAVDVPSGLDAEHGVVAGGTGSPVIRAACTVTFIADKPGLHTGLGPALAGRVLVDPLGLPVDALIASLASPLSGAPSAASPQAIGCAPGLLSTRQSVAHLVRVRSAISHKGTFGGVLILGGAPGTQGAAYLAALAAQAAGAGKVWLARPGGVDFEPSYPQLMTRAFEAPLEGVDSIAIGCGLGTSAAARARLLAVMASSIACVIDADGLNLLAGDAALFTALHRRSRDSAASSILTPHPLEAARLLGCDTSSIQADRIGCALRLAERSRAVVVLKGAGTVLARPDGAWMINSSGSPALATGGTGDVLAGVLASLLAQGYPAWSAACLGVWLHGRAGDLWHEAHPHGAGLNAARLTEIIPDAWPDGSNCP